MVGARKLNIAGFMILLALGVIAYLNIMQGGGTDVERNIDLQRLHRRVRLRLHLAHDRLQCRNPHDRAQVPVEVAWIVYQRTNTDAEAAADLLLPDEDELS